MTEWMTDIGRAPWVANSLRHRIKELRSASRRCRKAFRKEYMGVPAAWLADAYDEAADALQARLAQLDVANASPELVP